MQAQQTVKIWYSLRSNVGLSPLFERRKKTPNNTENYSFLLLHYQVIFTIKPKHLHIFNSILSKKVVYTEEDEDIVITAYFDDTTVTLPLVTKSKRY